MGPRTVTGQRPPDVTWLERRVRGLEDAVRVLQAARALGASNFVGGALRFQDDTGHDWFTLGNVPLSGGGVGEPTTDLYGVALRGDGAGVLLAASAGGRGLVMPEHNVPVAFNQPTYPVTPAGWPTGTWVDVWLAPNVWPVHEVLQVQAQFDTPVGQTAEVRLLEAQTGQVTAVASLVANRASIVYFDWIHPALCGAWDDRSRVAASFRIQVRRTGAGTGTVAAWTPAVFVLCSKLLHPPAATDGNPRVV
jgi:hypothetical protein